MGGVKKIKKPKKRIETKTKVIKDKGNLITFKYFLINFNVVQISGPSPLRRGYIRHLELSFFFLKKYE